MTYLIAIACFLAFCCGVALLRHMRRSGWGQRQCLQFGHQLRDLIHACVRGLRVQPLRDTVQHWLILF